VISEVPQIEASLPWPVLCDGSVCCCASAGLVLEKAEASLPWPVLCDGSVCCCASAGLVLEKAETLS